MIVLYDATGEAHPLSAYDNFSITHKLDGCDEMTFYVDTRHEQYPLLYEEARVVTDENEWLIKKIDDDKVDCELNFDFLKGAIYKDYKSATRSLTEVLESHLPEGWTIQGANVSSIRRTIEFDFCTDYDVVYQCMSTYKVYFVWRIRDKTVVVYSQTAMQPTGEYLTTELNLKSLSFKGDTTDFATRLYAYGKDGLTMEKAVVNGKEYGLPYVENRKYVDKTVCAYWSDERYTVPENLYADAMEKLETLAFPVRSYECDVVDLAKQNSDYSFLDFQMHKKVTLIDADRGIRVEHQIVEYKEYPDEPDRNVVTLSCVPETIVSSISSAVSTIKEDAEKTKTDYDSRLAMATAMLTGAFGGHVYSNGSELFIMDSEDPAQAKIVWRWNVNGFGKSSTGIDGPYTTALTFDDEFITNVINAMVIRGSLIEAGSVQAASISQSYTDSVLSQSYKAAEGLVKFEAQKITDYLTNDNGNGAIDVLQQEVSQIQQTIDGLRLDFSSTYTGGVNYVKNSSGLNGVSDDWEATGTVAAVQNADTKNTTVANSCFRLSADSALKQTIDDIVVGGNYTLSVKIKKTDSLLSQLKIIYNGESEAVIFSSTESSGWKEYTYTIRSIQSPTIEIKAETRGSYFYVADLMLCDGTTPKAWTPAPNEIYTSGVKIDKTGIEVYRSDSSEKTVINNTEFAGYYNDEEVFSLNKDETRVKKTTVRGDLTVGDCKFIPYAKNAESGLNIALID
jgi:phage minor structural protein